MRFQFVPIWIVKDEENQPSNSRQYRVGRSGLGKPERAVVLRRHHGSIHRSVRRAHSALRRGYG
ncbi:hypothetical protein CDO37_32305, partial [Pseudomonas aeruginosa]